MQGTFSIWVGSTGHDIPGSVKESLSVGLVGVGAGVQLPTGGKAETMDLRGVVPMRKPPGLTTRRLGFPV